MKTSPGNIEIQYSGKDPRSAFNCQSCYLNNLMGLEYLLTFMCFIFLIHKTRILTVSTLYRVSTLNEILYEKCSEQCLVYVSAQ